jgi:hypothetical protein
MAIKGAKETVTLITDNTHEPMTSAFLRKASSQSRAMPVFGMFVSDIFFSFFKFLVSYD